MRILLLSLPRSRSNFLTEAFAESYGFPNLREPYINLDPNDLDYSKKVKLVTDDLLKIQNFVCKLQSTNIDYPLFTYNEFQFNMYDEIYITARKNITEQIASLLVAKTNNVWSQYTKDLVIMADPRMHHIVFDKNKHMNILTEIENDIKKLIILKNQLIKDNIKVKTLYYEIIDDWAKDHLNNPKTLAQKSDYDYKKIIANYNELEEIVSNHFKNLELI